MKVTGKSMKKLRTKNKKQKKTRKHMRQMKGGSHKEIREYLQNNFDNIYGTNPFSNNQNYTENQKQDMIEDIMNSINILSKKITPIKNITDFINFIKQYDNQEYDTLASIFDPALIEYFKNLH
jgi:hypothetical protein